ncbi:hypothetical protein RBSH_00087 [Rhodopirellula baltica SH28]|uniref:Uncharacterized protein n=1 Tax=Rhodopirellula baltica SH28 TaxID=993517 RepID=K5DCL4_RHOBT|nr:hypothetical protein [Rhodopirellula baltica]EKK04472.1 hypothetical protein RBSH_00087 [Rhodopirellula baltica SH28]
MVTRRWSFLLLGMLALTTRPVSSQELTKEAIQEFNVLNRLVAPKVKAEAKQPIPPEFLKPLVNAELSFVHRVCEPTEEQMKAIVGSAEEAFDEMGDLLANNIRVAQLPRFHGLNGETLNANPIRRIRDDTMEFLPLLLTEKQFQKYKQESSQRDRIEREAAVDYLITLLDSKLVLSEIQQRELRTVFLSEWPSLDVEWINSYLNNPNFVPVIPSNLLRKVLNTDQQTAWASYQQVSMGVMIGQNAEQFLQKEWLP